MDCDHKFKAFLNAQIEEILKYKWIESEKRQCDIGDHQAAVEWINNHAHHFRKWWYDNHK